jgi:hypothetical protein
VILPALDRLAELVERVVDLLDGFVTQEHKPPPAPVEWRVQAVHEELVFQEHKLSVDGWVAFLGLPEGYRLVERDGAAPARGDRVEVEGTAFRVLRLGPSPLPGDRRRCAFLEREEPPPAERTT